MTDQGRNVGGEQAVFQIFEEGTQRDLRTAAIAQNEGRHAHPDEICCPRHLDDILRVSVHIDEARCHDQAVGINCFFRRESGLPQRNDAALMNRDIAPIGRRSVTVDNAAVADNQVHLRAREGRRYRREQKEGKATQAIHAREP